MKQSNLVEELMKMEENGEFQALFCQPKRGNNCPAPLDASAMIRYMPTQGGWQWALHGITPALTSSGIASYAGHYGTIDQILAYAEKEFDVGAQMGYSIWVPMKYTDVDFPLNMIPM